MSRPIFNNIPIIIVGDGTTHGGKVISGAPSAIYNGKIVARLGDMVSCPQTYPGGAPHGVNQIIEGDPNVIVDGKPIALQGHKTVCGCQLMASSSPQTTKNSTYSKYQDTEQCTHNKSQNDSHTRSSDDKKEKRLTNLRFENA